MKFGLEERGLPLAFDGIYNWGRGRILHNEKTHIAAHLDRAYLSRSNLIGQGLSAGLAREGNDQQTDAECDGGESDRCA
jgi:hypothetical protein